MHNIYLGVVSIFHTPLEASGLCVDILQDEVHKAAEFTWKYIPLHQETIEKSGTSCTLAPIQ